MVRIAGVLAEIRNKYLPNISLERCHYTSLLMSYVFILKYVT
jgi:hypothetical protein